MHVVAQIYQTHPIITGKHAAIAEIDKVSVGRSFSEWYPRGYLEGRSKKREEITDRQWK